MLALILTCFAMTSGITPPIPARVVIDASYPAGQVFVVRLRAQDATTVRGQTPKGFVPEVQTVTGSVRVWLAGMDGRFRVSANAGAVIIRVRRGGRSRVVHQAANGRIEFDRLGYPQQTPSDPSELLPIFPRRPVATDDEWSARAKVREGLGSGVGVYDYRVMAIWLAPNGHVLALLAYRVRGEGMHPPAGLAGWSSSIRGRGTMVWDCTAHERTRKQYRLVYEAVQGHNRIRETVTERDTMRRVR